MNVRLVPCAFDGPSRQKEEEEEEDRASVSPTADA